MAAADSFVGEGLNPSPYKEALAECERLREALRGVMRFALPITALDVQDFNRARVVLRESTTRC